MNSESASSVSGSGRLDYSPQLLESYELSRNLYPCLDVNINENDVPIIYSKNYDINCFGLQKLHPFDVTKWGRILKLLVRNKVIKANRIVQPKRISQKELDLIHTKVYLDSLTSNRTIAEITEMSIVQCVPTCILQRKLLKPLQFQVGGSALGVRLALEKGWAINLGGGFHHCSASKGGGFCIYADISLCVKVAQCLLSSTHRIMIIDLDAHQGNGYATDLAENRTIFIMDVYNPEIYPKDLEAATAVRLPILIESYTEDNEYLRRISRSFGLCLSDFEPHLVIYNAGTDCLTGDPLGKLALTENGVIQRDEIVFKACKDRGIPILMLTSGGYLTENAKVIANSITNLIHKQIITI